MPAAKDTLDFIVIGAQKSGTTSLFQYLRRHPEVFIPIEKEVPYFSHDPAVHTVEWATYIGNIARKAARAAPDAAHLNRKWCTVTPHYGVGGVWEAMDGLADGNGYDERTVPRRIRERLPDVRLIAILRDPVERAVSHHRMLVRRGVEKRTLDEAIDELLRPEALEHSRRHPGEQTGYIVWGEYGRILSGYFDAFDREQMLVVFTDELERDSSQLLRRIQDFIGVSADFQPDNLGESYNVGRAERGFSWTSPSSWMGPTSPLSPQGVRRELRSNQAARGIWRSLPAERRRRLKRRHERLAVRTARWNRRKPPNEVKANAQPSPATLARLREHFTEDGERLSGLLGVTPPWLVRAEGETPPR